MTLHDDFARWTPAEMALGDRDAAEAFATRAFAEAAARSVDDADPGAFVMLDAVRHFLTDLRGDDAAPETAHGYGLVAFQAAHFFRAGCPLYLLSTSIVRSLVAETPPGRPIPPSEGGYLQLPQHLFWVSEPGGGGMESVDGIFWTRSQSDDLQVLLASGMRPDRPGIGAIALPMAPLADAPLWAEAEARASGPDFEVDLPGAELDELYSFQTAGEPLKLLARFFAALDGDPGRVAQVEPAAGDGPGPRPSSLPFKRVTQG